MSVVFQRMAPYFGWRSLSQANFVNDLVLSSLRNRNTHSLFLCLEGSSAGSYLSLERAVSLDFQFRTYFTARWVYLINTWSINSAGRASQWEILTITWILLVHRVNFNLCTAPRYMVTTKNRAISLASPGRRFGRMARNISLYHESVEWLHLSLTKKLDVDSGRCSYIELINNLSSLIRALEYLPTLDCNLCV